MDVDKYAFQARLLDILLAVGEASFVSFDLELSGVPVFKPGQASGRPSLQERYTETKEAAEKYHILQIGLTCVRENDCTGEYLCKPFNFNLSPIVQEKRLDIDRTFAFHSGAVEFLLGVGFHMNLPFTLGVPYLSRPEAALAEHKAKNRSDRSVVADIQVKPEDLQSIAFMQRVRTAIADWSKNNDDHSLVITPITENGRPQETELSRFERRLVHQLVRAEFPSFVTVPFKGNIRILHFDKEREDRFEANRLKDARESINRQTGFRWIIEALAGNPPTHLDVKQFAVNPATGEPAFVNLDTLKDKYWEAQRLSLRKKTVLVGHNMFLDLIYLYKTFIGPLPDHVDEFIALIHDLFPLIVDTKYMATHNCGDINPRSSLEEIAEQLALEPYPNIQIHENHSKYKDNAAFHEAGYDSLLTAQIAARLSAKLDAAGSWVADISDPESADESGGVSLNDVATGSATAKSPSPFFSALNGVKDLALAPLRAIGLPGQEDKVSGDAQAAEPVPIKSKQQRKRDKKKLKQAGLASAGRFAHATVFDQLREITGDSEEDERPEWDVPRVNDSETMETSSDKVTAADWETPYFRREAGRGMPKFDSDFWRVYGNKLRVFGTEEGVCLLNP